MTWRRSKYKADDDRAAALLAGVWFGGFALLIVGAFAANEAINHLLSAGYPEDAKCVVCGVELGSRGFDWWSLDGVSGHCCGMGKWCQGRKGE